MSVCLPASESSTFVMCFFQSPVGVVLQELKFSPLYAGAFLRFNDGKLEETFLYAFPEP